DHRAAAAGAAIDVDPCAGLELAAGEEAEVSGDADQGTGRGLLIRDAVRNRVSVVLANETELRARAGSPARALARPPDAVAGLELLDPRADGIDDAHLIDTPTE